jgi:Tfp pilus assembly protein PilN
MPFINLIQEHVIAGKRERKRARVALGCFVVAIAMATGANGYCILQSETLDSDIAELKKEADKHKTMLSQIDKNREEMLDLAPRLKILSNAQIMTKRWATVLDHLSKQTPPGTWLSAVRTQGSDPTKPLTLSFQGISTRQELVGEFMLRLQACAELENVNLKFTGEKIASHGKGIEFDISAELAGTAEAKAKDEQKENKS